MKSNISETDEVAMTAAELTTIVRDAVNESLPKSFKRDEPAEIEFPVSHRSGNLSVAHKQLLNAIMKGKNLTGEIPAEILNDGIPDSILKKAQDAGKRFTKRLETEGTKALTAVGAGAGAELLAIDLSSTLLQRMYLESQLAQALIANEVQMPSNPFSFPLTTTRPTFRLGAERTITTEGAPGTAKLLLTAAKLIAMSEYDYEADEDAIIAVLPMITQQLGSAAADSLEDAIVNGDVLGTQDTGTAADSQVKAFDGLRKLALAQASLKVSFATGGISSANISALRKALGRWGLDPSKLLLVVGPNALNDAILLPETLTAEKAGSQSTARILTGLAPSIFGIDILASARVREDLNAAGVYDGVTTTKGSVLLLYKPAWIIGTKRGVVIESFKDVKLQTNFIVGSMRRAFAPIEGLSSTRAAAIGYNYTA